MAKETLNIVARFTFRGQPGISQVQKTSKHIRALKKSFTGLKSGASMMQGGFMKLGMAGVVAGAGILSVVKKSATFNKQMSVVKSVISDIDKQGFQKLRNSALEWGAVTSFSSQQAAEGMEQLGRASFDANQIVEMIGPSLRMAEADSMEMATSTRIMATTMKQFNIQGHEGWRVANALAYASANSNTNITLLGESLKFAGTVARSSGQTFEDTVASLGLIANIGVRGTLGGTALKNAFMKLTRGTKVAIKLFGGRKGFNAVIEQGAKGGFRRINEVMLAVYQRLKLVKSPAERAGKAFQMFGLRGKAAYDAFVVAFEQAKKKDLGKMFTGVGEAAKKGADGIASSMAKTRLNNLAGDWIIFTSAMNNAAIAMGDMLHDRLRPLMGGMKEFGKNLGGAINMMNADMSEWQVAEKYGNTIAGVAFGMREAVNELETDFRNFFGWLSKTFGLTEEGGKRGIKAFVKMSVKIIGFLVLMTPFIGAIAGMGFMVSGVFGAIGGGIKVFVALMNPALFVITAITLAIVGAKKKGESTFEYMIRAAGRLKYAFMTLTAPIRYMVKELGVVKGLMASIAIAGIAKKGYSTARSAIGGAIARSGGMGGRLLGGAVAKHGMPVYVTNFHEAPGGLGGSAGLIGPLAAAVPNMAGFGASLTAAAGPLAVMAFTAYGVVKAFQAVARAHDPKYIKKIKRKRLLEAGIDNSWKDGPKDRHGQLKNFDLYNARKQKRKTWSNAQKWGGEIQPGANLMGDLRGMQGSLGTQEDRDSHMINKIGPFFKQMAAVGTMSGRTGDAQKMIHQSGLWEMAKNLKNMHPDNVKKMGLDSDMIRVINTLVTGTKDATDKIAVNMQRPIYIQMDGKTVAVLLEGLRQESTDRGGGTTKPGAKSKIAQKGKR